MSTPGQMANPSGESDEGLSGDLGVSSERTGPFEGVEGTGTSGSAQGRTDGDAETHPGQARPSSEVHRQEQEVEENTAEVPSHDDVRAANPHPRRDES